LRFQRAQATLAEHSPFLRTQLGDGVGTGASPVALRRNEVVSLVVVLQPPQALVTSKSKHPKTICGP
jgi:hypothetical protein